MSRDLKKNILCVTEWTIHALVLFLAVAYVSGWEWTLLTLLEGQARLIPAYALYYILRSVIGGNVSVAITSLTILLLGSINKIKMAASGEPLVFYDLLAVHQGAQLTIYANRMLVCIALALALVLAWAFLSIFRRKGRLWYSWKAGLFGVVLVIVSLFPYYPQTLNLRERLKFGFSDIAQIQYLPWDMPANLRQNGMPFHLIFTSVKHTIRHYSAAELAAFETKLSFRKVSKHPSSWLPKTLVLVLCEACWGSRSEGYAAFSTLRERGFDAVDMIAPVYGGGTVNSEFEMLTGLPAKKLTGIVYQEYHKEISAQGITLPAALKARGYGTIAIHNYHRTMWRRDQVLPKLGVDRFIALDNMDYEGSEYFPTDDILFRKVDSILAERVDPTFVLAITVSTHGPFKEVDGDGGGGDYSRRLQRSLAEVERFARNLDATHSDYLMVIFGDHKPAIAKYFFDKKIFPASLFRKLGHSNDEFRFKFGVQESKAIIGQVPVLIKSSKAFGDYNEFLEKIDGKPLFCFMPELDAWLNSDLDPSFSMMKRNCEREGLRYSNYKDFYPEILYYRNLFMQARRSKDVGVRASN